MEEAAEFERTLSDCISIDNIVLPPHETIPAKKSRIDDPHSKEKQASIKSNTKQSKPSTYSFAIDSTASRCMYCEQSHKPLSCRNYSNLSLEDRAERVRKHKACYRCLESTHLGRNCKRNEPCNINGCRAIHHPSIHGYGRIWKETAIGNEMPPRNASREESLMETSTAESEASSWLSNALPTVALNVVPVFVEANNKSVRTYALLDTGSTGTFIQQSIASILNLDGLGSSCNVTTINGSSRVPCKIVSFSISQKWNRSRTPWHATSRF